MQLRLNNEEHHPTLFLSIILSILTLGATQATELRITAEGNDAAEAIFAIAELFEHGFFELEQTDP